MWVIKVQWNPVPVSKTKLPICTLLGASHRRVKPSPGSRLLLGRLGIVLRVVDLSGVAGCGRTALPHCSWPGCRTPLVSLLQVACCCCRRLLIWSLPRTVSLVEAEILLQAAVHPCLPSHSMAVGDGKSQGPWAGGWTGPVGPRGAGTLGFGAVGVGSPRT